jgi:hypothetical protein
MMTTKLPIALSIRNTSLASSVLVDLVKSQCGVDLFTELNNYAVIMQHDCNAHEFLTDLLEIILPNACSDSPIELALEVPDRLVLRLRGELIEGNDVVSSFVSAIKSARLHTEPSILEARASMYTAYWRRLV